jgi:hypothetical protein
MNAELVPVIVDKARRKDDAAEAQQQLQLDDYAEADEEAWLDAVLSGYEGIDLSEDDRLRKSSSSTAGQKQGQTTTTSSSSKSHPCMLRRLVGRLAEMWKGQ